MNVRRFSLIARLSALCALALLLVSLTDRSTFAAAQSAPPLDVAAIALRGRQRQLARQQVVAGVAGGNLHDLAAFAQILDVLSENDFHRPTPRCTG